ncbi:MAG: HD domain-containing protein [Deltaproteobacteria bacterium]|nr:HD domain-containing protein [Deltaproteobacteria bacterium]
MTDERDLARVFAAIPEDVLGICQRLRDRGKRGWVVGGCVRDVLLGRAAKDWDVATDALPDEVTAAFRKVIPTGIKHGTVTVLVHGTPYEVTTLRGEGAYHDGRRPAEVRFLDDITEDLARRDFTMNAIAVDPLEQRLIDPFDGKRDLDARLLRAVGEPAKRFAEDGLRILRGARFAAVLECTIEPMTLAAMGDTQALATYAKVSAERIHDEWMKALVARSPSIAFELMRTTGMLALTCPELCEGFGCEQNRWHAYDVWGHTMSVLDACEGDRVLRLAAVLHDVGKPRSREFSDKTNDYTFYNHEAIGATMSDAILRRLRASNEDRARVVELVRHHLICYSPEWTDAAVRRWLRRVTPQLSADLLALGRADALGKGRPADDDLTRLAELSARTAALLAAGAALTARDLAIDGRGLMAELGLAPGRIVGELQRALVELVTDDPSLNSREHLIEQARRWIRDGIPSSNSVRERE